MARQCHVHLISKLRSDSALSWPYTGRYAGRGPHRTYGSKLDYRNIPETYLQATTVEGPLQPRLSQAQLRPQEFSPTLHVVIIVNMTRQTPAWAPVLLFSRDRELPLNVWRDDSCLRVQRALNFRDAQQ
jgi:putative transposase